MFFYSHGVMYRLLKGVREVASVFPYVSKHEYAAVCPFCGGEMRIWPSRYRYGWWRCLGCGREGNLLRLARELEGARGDGRPERRGGEPAGLL